MTIPHTAVLWLIAGHTWWTVEGIYIDNKKVEPDRITPILNEKRNFGYLVRGCSEDDLCNIQVRSK